MAFQEVEQQSGRDLEGFQTSLLWMMLDVLAGRRELEIVNSIQMIIVLVVKGLVLFALIEIYSLTIKYNSITWVAFMRIYHSAGVSNVMIPPCPAIIVSLCQSLQ